MSPIQADCILLLGLAEKGPKDSSMGQVSKVQTGCFFYFSHSSPVYTCVLTLDCQASGIDINACTERVDLASP